VVCHPGGDFCTRWRAGKAWPSSYGPHARSAPTLPLPLARADAEVRGSPRACCQCQRRRCEHFENLLIELESTRSLNSGAARGVGRRKENCCPRSQTARHFENRGRSSSEHHKREPRSRRTPNSGATPVARRSLLTSTRSKGGKVARRHESPHGGSHGESPWLHYGIGMWEPHEMRRQA
jgi:hypothetical protein